MFLKIALSLLIFSFSEQDVLGQCTGGFPMNMAVYEGTQNISMMCNSPTKVSWTLKPASDEISTHTITNYNDIIAPAYANLYGVNSASLIIKKGQGVGTIPPISTAGLYIIKHNGSNMFGAQLTVVRQPPSCSCSAINSTKINITCILTYANTRISPIGAKMTWMTNGNFYKNDTPAGSWKVSNAGYFTSTSFIIADAYDPSSYQCMVTFTKPGAGSSILATNSPTFSDYCTPSFCGAPTTTIPTSTATEPTTTALPTTTTEPTKTTLSGCTCLSQDQHCTKDDACRSVGTNLTDVYNECVVKAELYARYDNCCPENLVCGVVVTLRNDSRWLIHDSLCNDNRCEMVVFDASCMTTGWKLLTERKIIISGVGDYVKKGNGVQIGLNATDCSESCNRMINLP